MGKEKKAKILFRLFMSSRLLKICHRRRGRTLAKSINYTVKSSDEFVTNLHQRILAKLKNNENNNLYPIGTDIFIFIKHEL